MGRFQTIEFDIDGVMLFKPKVFEDDRGFFTRIFEKTDMWDYGLRVEFVEIYHAFPKKGVLRGLYFQKVLSQGKLVRVIKGKVFDVAVDLRDGSSPFGKWVGGYLSEENKGVFYIPRGFADGFLALTDDVHFIYMVTDYYYPESDGGVRWNDPDIGVEWPIDEIEGVENLILSDMNGVFPYEAIGIRRVFIVFLPTYRY